MLTEIIDSDYLGPEFYVLYLRYTSFPPIKTTIFVKKVNKGAILNEKWKFEESRTNYLE